MSPDEERELQKREGQVRRLRGRVAELKAALKSIEYGGEAGACPECSGKPHMPKCALAIALRSNADA